MKRIILLLVVVAISHTIALPQPCLPNGITFNSQTVIDNFQTNYPGCTEIEGDVIIFGGSPDYITNLLGLNVITSIGGSLYCGFVDGGNPELISLAGLENLTSIGGGLLIFQNNILNNLTGLNGLKSIGGNLSIDSNSSLTSLTGLENLTSIGGGLYIFYNNALTSLTGLDSLTSIGGDLYIVYNTFLASLSKLENLTSIGGYLYIGHTSSLASLHELENLTSIGGDLRIEHTYSLTSLSGIDNIIANSIDSIFIQNNDKLSECDVKSICDNLAASNGKIKIHDNAPGCDNIEEVQEACPNDIEETKTGNVYTIVPNPAKEKITISLPAITGFTILSIFNVSGEKILERQLSENETQFDTSTLPRGVYFVRLQNEKMVAVGKLIRN